VTTPPYSLILIDRLMEKPQSALGAPTSEGSGVHDEGHREGGPPWLAATTDRGYCRLTRIDEMQSFQLPLQGPAIWPRLGTSAVISSEAPPKSDLT
jgi:hypothetical protein